jgi:hypothetical protein
MKILVLTFASILGSLASSSQTYKSHSVIKMEPGVETEIKDRIITINEKEISITNFMVGTKTLYLTVNKIENKILHDVLSGDDTFKTFYCTTKDKDPYNGYQKAIVYVRYSKIMMGLFSEEITVYQNQFSTD